MEYCAICGTPLESNEDEVCRGCEVGEPTALKIMSDDNFINQIDLPQLLTTGEYQ